MSKQSLLYGWHSVMAALNDNQETIKQIYLSDSLKDERKKKEIIDSAKRLGISIKSVPRDELDKLSDGQNHQGVMLFCEEAAPLTETELWPFLQRLQSPAFILILDGVQDPHNLGAIIRTANCAGVNCIIAPKDRAVGLTPTVRKVASGAAEYTPFFQVTNLARVMEALKREGVWIYGLAGEAEQLIYEEDFAGSTALVMGAEGKGLRHNTKQHCDKLISIPMASTVASLNVSVATGVVLFEVVRRRSK